MNAGNPQCIGNILICGQKGIEKKLTMLAWVSSDAIRKEPRGRENNGKPGGGNALCPATGREIVHLLS